MLTAGKKQRSIMGNIVILGSILKQMRIGKRNLYVFLADSVKYVFKLWLQDYIEDTYCYIGIMLNKEGNLKKHIKKLKAKQLKKQER